MGPVKAELNASLKAGRDLTFDEAHALCETMLTGAWPDEQAETLACAGPFAAGRQSMSELAMHHDALLAELVRIVRATPWLFGLLEMVRNAAPAGAYVAAGAVRDSVWNFLTGRASSGPHGDVDVVYWADSEAPDASRAHEARLRAHRPDLDWEVTNQATIHLWHRRVQGLSSPPHQSVAEGLATWPETATAVGVRLTPEGAIDVLAPLGLVDLFALRLRHNPAQAGLDVFWQRIEAKQWLRRWPELEVIV